MPEDRPLADNECYHHGRSDCRICPYYTYRFNVGEHSYQGAFWIGQQLKIVTSDDMEGVWIEPRQYERYLDSPGL